MHVCGIIAEYDPFHTGHARQISAVRETLGDDCAVVCVMSGNWTQRGSPAIVNKHLRTRLALLGGADLVLELPLPYAISSAEWFARGGVSTLNSTGVVTHICFGSECGDVTVLKQAADCLDSDAYKQELRIYLDKGLSYPVARQNAATRIIGDAADCLSLPNNNLGVEYLRALTWCSSNITPITVLRQGAGHGEDPKGGYSSATYLRQLIKEGRINDAQPYFIPQEGKLLADTETADPLLAERAFLHRLRCMTEENLSSLPDCGEGLSHRLYQAIRQSSSTEDILSLVKTKRYTHARLRRILTWAYLGLSISDRPEMPPYIRVLGMNETGRGLLRDMSNVSDLPILTKPAHVRRMSVDAQKLFDLESRATDLYGLCLPTPPACGTEWTRSPEIM